MNALDVMKYGNLTVLGTLDGVPQSEWTTPNVCGWWSTKDIIAHLASFEQVLVEVLDSFLEGGPTPTLNRLNANPQRFNDDEVPARQHLSPREALAEYEALHAQVMALAARIPAQQFRQTGALPWYGSQYDLDDFISYQYYGHKREHCAQINVFKDSLKARG